MVRLPGTVHLVAVGKLRTPHWRSAQSEYLGRLRHYTDVVVNEVRDEVAPNVSDELAISREGESLLEAVVGIPWVIALDATGKQAGSVRFARYLKRQIEIYHELAFVIGGPFGLSTDVLGRADERLSLSMFTFPHELARVILLEQLYRAMTILSGEQYHK